MNKRIKIIFTVSIILNLMLISLMAGKYFHHRYSVHQQISELTEKFPTATAERVEQMIRDLQQERRDRRHIMRNARNAAFDTLKAEEFDAVLFKQKMHALEISRNQTFQQYTDAIAVLAATMSQEEREHFATYLKQRKGGIRRRSGRMPDKNR